MSTTKTACVIGWPINHSRSPMLHNYWLKHYGLAGHYDRRAVAPKQLEDFIAEFHKSGLVGANVTIPHKEAVFRLVKPADTLTKKLGAINTLYLEDGELRGTNTDGYGFVANVQQVLSGFEFRKKNIIILGAGGAARSIAGRLLEEEVAQITIVNRSLERAQELKRDFCGDLQVSAWPVTPARLTDADVVINTTALGMAGQPALDLSLDALPDHAIVCDIVYVPLMTPLLERAAQRGLRTVDGLGMLMHQAVPAFEKWFGVKPVVTPELRELLVNDIKGDPT